MQGYLRLNGIPLAPTNSNFTSLFQRVSKNDRSLEFLQCLVGLESVMPLDSENIFSIIQTAHYKAIQKQLQESRQVADELKLKYNNNFLEVIQLKEKSKLQSHQISLHRQNEVNLLAHKTQLDEKIKDLNLKLTQMQHVVYSVQIEASKLQLAEHRRQVEKAKISSEYVSKLHISTQTNPIDFRQHKQIATSIEYAEKRELIPQFQHCIEYLCVEMEKQVQKVKSVHLDTKQLLRQNDALKEENALLNAKISAIDHQNQKMTLWKQKLNEFITNVEDGISKEDEQVAANVNIVPLDADDMTAKLRSLEKRNMDLVTKIVDLKLKQRSTESLMQCDQEISDEGPVACLVKLSEEIKHAVRNLLLDL